MIKLKKYIALLLFGTFFFPMVFQPNHIVWHYFHDHQDADHSVKTESKGIPFQALVQAESQQTSSCPISEYQFSTTSLADLTVYRQILPVLESTLITPVVDLVQQQLFTTKPSRAPPVLPA